MLKQRIKELEDELEQALQCNQKNSNFRDEEYEVLQETVENNQRQLLSLKIILSQVNESMNK